MSCGVVRGGTQWRSITFIMLDQGDMPSAWLLTSVNLIIVLRQWLADSGAVRYLAHTWVTRWERHKDFFIEVLWSPSTVYFLVIICYINLRNGKLATTTLRVKCIRKLFGIIWKEIFLFTSFFLLPSFPFSLPSLFPSFPPSISFFLVNYFSVAVMK